MTESQFGPTYHNTSAVLRPRCPVKTFLIYASSLQVRASSVRLGGLDGLSITNGRESSS